MDFQGKKYLLLSIILLFSLPGFAHEFEYTFGGKTLIYNVTNDEERTAEIIGGRNISNGGALSGEVQIPVSVKDPDGVRYSVTSIGRSAFSGCEGLTAISIGESVVSIDSYAFNGCYGLTSVTIPASVTSIGYSAFYGCRGLKDVIFTDGNEDLSLGSFVFANVSLESLYLGRNVSCVSSTLANQPFYGQTSLLELSIGNSVTSISNYAFFGCSALSSVEIPSSVTKIGQQAFFKCDSLKELTLADGSEPLSLGNWVFSGVPLENVYWGRNFSDKSIKPFSGNDSLSRLTIGDFVTFISFESFRNCSSLKSLTIGGSVETIGDYAFEGCRALTSLIIPNSVTSIGSQAFYNCESIREVILSDGSDSLDIGSQAFYNIPLETLYLGRTISSSSYRPFCDNILLTQLTISNTVTSISPSAFDGCSGLKSLVIPDSTVEIGNSAFWGCSGLSKVIIGNGVRNISDSAFRDCRGMELLEIGNSVDIIGDYAFRDCASLTSLVLPNSVTEIGGEAFSDCTAMTSLTLGNSVKSIGLAAFQACKSIESLILPNSVIEVGNSAFNKCSSLSELTLGNSIATIGVSAFYGCSGLTSLFIPKSVTEIGAMAFKECTGITEITIEDGTETLTMEKQVFAGVPLESLYLGRDLHEYYTSISDLPFNGKTSLKQLIIGDYVTTIHSNTFFRCRDLTSLTIPNSITLIGSSAFSQCSKLWNVTIEDGNEPLSVGTSVFSGSPLGTVYLGRQISLAVASAVPPFYGQESLRNLTFGEAVTEIGDLAFYGCSALSALDLPETVASIGTKSFYGCRSLKTVSLPSSFTSIGSFAFSGCRGLNDLKCYAHTPPAVYIDSFEESIYDECKLQVWYEDMERYKEDPVWSKFLIASFPIPVESIELNPESWSGQEGDSFHITANVFPENATDKTIKWSSSDETIAKVYTNGLVILQSEGFCTITATAGDGSGVEAYCLIDITTGVENILVDDKLPISVFTPSGINVLYMEHPEKLKTLPSGTYIIHQGSSVKKIRV